MIGPRALRLCSTCLARQQPISRASAARLASSSSSTSSSTSTRVFNSRGYHVESSRVDTSAFELPTPHAAAPLPSTSTIAHSTVFHDRAGYADGLESDVDEDWQPREERRSPAAVFGSKRVGLEIIPEALEERIQAEIAEHHPREIRDAFLSLLAPASDKKSRSPKSKKGRYDENGAVLAVAKAATVLPGDYAVMSNILRELRGRLGSDWLDKEEGGVLEMSSGHGPGLLALCEGQTVGKQMRLVHTNRHGLELAKRLFSASQTNAGSDGLAAPVAEDTAETGSVMFDRKLAPVNTDKTSLVMSTFYLSTLPTASSRQVHLRQLLARSPAYLVLVDRSSPSGWQAISEARSYITSQPEGEWHLIAPCPHEFACPLAMTGGKDRCSFSQKLQRPSFTRKTKHASKGEEDVNYTYLVIGRGPRPSASSATEATFSNTGRIGGVGREAAEKEAIKLEGKSELREVEGGEFEMVSLANRSRDSSSSAKSSQTESQPAEHNEGVLRAEAYTWPRVVAPPMKRAGHVILDTCYPDGHIQRLTYAKSHSKQVYHDARKSAWGDLFPHEPKSKIVRKRGIRKLVREEGFTGFGEVEQELDDGLGDEALTGLDHLPVGELRAADGEDEVITWKSGSTSASGTLGQRRQFSSSTTTRRPLVSDNGRAMGRRHMSARPESQPTTSASTLRPKVTLNTLRTLAAEGTPITCLTAYDFPTALLSETAGMDMVLVGDSLSQVALGHTSTTEVTLDEMIHHAKAVTRGAKSPFVFADMPMGSFETSVSDGVRNVIRMIKESGVDGVKIEGGREIVPLVRRLAEIGIPVIPHIGLQPQRATALSGYLVQGKSAQSAMDLFETARLLREAGATGFLLEAIPHRLAKYITEQLDTLTIGIGAGPDTHGQVLVITDVLGLYNGEAGGKPRFVRHFGQVGKEMKRAVEGYKQAITAREFPELGKETYAMKKEEWEGFLAARSEQERQQQGKKE